MSSLQEAGWGDTMTEPRPWPNNAIADRDTAAECLQVILQQARQAAARAKGDPIMLHALLLIIDDAQTALRCLERQGANTVPVPRL